MRRQPNKNERLDWEELENAPNTRGAFSFLRPQSPVINIQEHRQQNQETSLPPARHDKTSTVGDMSTLDVSTAMPPSSTRARPYKLHRCYTVQDGHSVGENQLLSILWRLGVAELSTSSSPDTKRVTMGWDRLARSAGMSDKAAKRNLTLLIEKLAVELIAFENSATRTGRTYRVYSYAAILQRRMDAGMLYAVRDKGVRFVSSPEAEALSERQIAKPTDKTSTVDITYTVDKTSTVTVDITSPDTVDITSTPLNSSLSIKKERTTTTDMNVALIVEALSCYVTADENAAMQIARESISACDSALTEEIVSVIHEKAPAILRNRSIANPLGLLIRAVPRCFEGSGIFQLRKQWAAEKDRLAEREREQHRQNQEFVEWVARERRRCEATLADPTSTDKARAAASKQLTELASH
jgi:hypothetical protein